MLARHKSYLNRLGKTLPPRRHQVFQKTLLLDVQEKTPWYVTF